VAGGIVTASYTPTGLTAGVTYYWQIVARNSGGATTGPVWSFATQMAAPAAPSSPTPSSGASGVATSATFTWTAPGATSFDVLFGTSNPPPQMATGIAAASFSATGLTAQAT
jgi:hypothetical protein